jgi:plastocyanin
MLRNTLGAALVAALALALAASAWGGAAKVTKLTGTVGPGFTIVLKKAGKKVKKLKHGRYKFSISDKASNHNFVLERVKGGHFERTFTGIGFVGHKTITLTLKKGKYKYYCAPHEAIMKGFFTVT